MWIMLKVIRWRLDSSAQLRMEQIGTWSVLDVVEVRLVNEASALWDLKCQDHQLG